MNVLERFLRWATPTPRVPAAPEYDVDRPERQARHARNRILAEAWQRSLERQVAALDEAVGDLRVELELHALAE